MHNRRLVCTLYLKLYCVFHIASGKKSAKPANNEQNIDPFREERNVTRHIESKYSGQTYKNRRNWSHLVQKQKQQQKQQQRNDISKKELSQKFEAHRRREKRDGVGLKPPGRPHEIKATTRHNNCFR